MNTILTFSIVLLLFTNEQQPGGAMTDKNKATVRNFISEFWNNQGAKEKEYTIACVCGEKVSVSAPTHETAVTSLIPAMDNHVAAKEHPEVPKNLSRDQKEGMVRATMKNSSADTYLSAQYIDHSLPPGIPPGITGFQMIAGTFKSAFPDIRISVEDQIAEGDMVVSRVLLKGTNTGSFMGAPPTNKQIVMPGIRIDRMEGGRIVEHWAVADQMSMLQQLGMAPTQAQSK